MKVHSGVCSPIAITGGGSAAAILPKKEGYVYALENPIIPGVLKIGMTQKTPAIRCDEINREGGAGKLPTNYVCLWSKYVDDCRAVEQLIHLRLKAFRINPKREFFTISLPSMLELITDEISPYFIND